MPAADFALASSFEVSRGRFVPCAMARAVEERRLLRTLAVHVVVRRCELILADICCACLPPYGFMSFVMHPIFEKKYQAMRLVSPPLLRPTLYIEFRPKKRSQETRKYC